MRHAILVSLLLALSGVVSAEHHQKNHDQKAIDKAIQVNAKEGVTAMIAIDEALVAVRNNKKDQAAEHIKAATQSLQQLISHLPKDKSVKGQQHRTLFVPIYGEVHIIEAVSLTPEQQQKVAKAEKSSQKGDHHQAIKDLEDVGVAVIYSFIELPPRPVLAHVIAASKALEAGDNKKAKLALLLAERSLRIDSVTLVSEAEGEVTEKEETDKKS